MSAKKSGWWIEPIGFVTRTDDEYGPFADEIEASEAMDDLSLGDAWYKIVWRP